MSSTNPIRLSLPINTSALLRLADSQVSQTAADFGSLAPEIRESLARLANERKIEVADAAAEQILNLLQAKDDFLLAQSQQIASLQNQIDSIKGLMGKVQLTTNYGNTTQNYLPLAKILGQGTPNGAKTELLSVPNGWTAPVAAAAETRATA